MELAMELQCDICFIEFDLNQHRPKSLPCGHTICRNCVQNPALKKKCPNCRKHVATDPASLPDNIFVIQMMEKAGAPPRREDPKVQQLQRGVDAGRTLVQVLEEAVPMAVKALNRLLNSTVTQLRQMEESLETLQRGAGGDEGRPTTPDQLQLAVQLQDSLRLLMSTAMCSVVADAEGGEATWKASVQLAQFDHFLPLLLLQLRADGHLQEVPVAAVAAHAEPPKLSVLTIAASDLEDGRLKVNDILRHGQRWRNIRILNNLQGTDSEDLLRVMEPHVEEIKIMDKATPFLMAEVEKMSKLKRLIVTCDGKELDYPDLPLQLEELWIENPNEDQLHCVLQMPRLRSLYVSLYPGPNTSFPPAQDGGALLWLGFNIRIDLKDTMLSLLRFYSRSLRELQICCVANDDNYQQIFFPDLGPDLVSCGLLALRRLVLQRPFYQCTEVAACMVQLQIIRGFLPPPVEVLCNVCHQTML